MSIGEGAGLCIEVEEVVHQEDTANAEAVFDDLSVNGSSDEWVSGFDGRLEKIDV